MGAALMVVWFGRVPQPMPSPHELLPADESMVLTSGLVEAALEQPTMGVYEIDGLLPPRLLARDLPSKPFANSKLEPCSGSQKAIRGACWVATEDKPDCPDDQYEYKGKCWVPVLVPLAPKPSSQEPQPKPISE